MPNLENPPNAGLRVVKLGGSLLSRPSLAADLRDWAGRQTPTRPQLYIIGGGPLLNAVRDLDQIHGFDQRAMHWRCVRMLRYSFELLGELIPEWAAIETPAEFAASLRQRSFANHTRLAVDAFFTPQCDGGLQPSWSTTTDAIAAFLAVTVNARELVVLKSCDVDSTMPPREQVRRAVLDPQFPAACVGIPSVRVQKLPSSGA